jgi:hypothetical protein
MYQSNNKESCSLAHDLSPGNFNKIFKVWKIAFGTNQNTIDLTFVLNLKHTPGPTCQLVPPPASASTGVRHSPTMHARSSAAQDFKRSNTPYTSFLLFPPSSHLPSPHHCPLQPTEAPSSKHPQREPPVSTATNARFFTGETLLHLSFPHRLRPVRPPLFLEQGWFHQRGGSARPGGVCASTLGATACFGLCGGGSGRQGFRPMGACGRVYVGARPGITARRWGCGQ